MNNSSRTACTDSALQYMIEYDEIANHIHPNDLAPESDLSGSIPAELGNLTALTALLLQDNKLSGEEGILAIV